MVSEITATLDPERDAIDALAALFPCGSITGAPKIRAMELIAEVERHARGTYCGAIGRIESGGDAAFNVMGDWAEGYFRELGKAPGTDYGWAPTPGSDGVFQFLSDSFVRAVGAPDPEAATFFDGQPILISTMVAP